VPLQRDMLAAAIYGRSHAPHAADASLIPLCALHSRVLASLRKASAVRPPLVQAPHLPVGR